MSDSSIRTLLSPGGEDIQEEVTNYDPSESRQPNVTTLEDDHYNFSDPEDESQAESKFTNGVLNLVPEAINIFISAVTNAIVDATE
jgi:hypothetical protein